MMVSFGGAKGGAKGEVGGRAPVLAPARRPWPSPAGQLVHFAWVGWLSTVSFAFLFALLYGPLGPVRADIAALALCALGNLVANRRFTFATTGPSGRRNYYLTGLLLTLLPLATTLVALALSSAAGLRSLPADIFLLTLANLSATLVRFYTLRRSVAGAR